MLNTISKSTICPDSFIILTYSLGVFTSTVPVGIYAFKCFDNIKAIFETKNVDLEEKEDELETTEGEG